MKSLNRFLRNESGATVIEYGLICSLLFLGIVAGVTNFASKSNIMYGHIAANMH